MRMLAFWALSVLLLHLATALQMAPLFARARPAPFGLSAVVSAPTAASPSFRSKSKADEAASLPLELIDGELPSWLSGSCMLCQRALASTKTETVQLLPPGAGPPAKDLAQTSVAKFVCTVSPRARPGNSDM